MSSNHAWEHLILKSHAEVTLSDETCRSTWNKAMNKMINDAYDLSLLLTKHQRIKVMTRLMLIQK